MSVPPPEFDSFKTLLKADGLDGKDDFSDSEKAALGLVLDVYETVPSDLMKNDKLLQSRMKETLGDFYRAIKDKKPKPQLVFVDLSELQATYKTTWEPHTGQKWDVWKGTLLKELESHYTLANGKKLNITFTAEKPKGKTYTTVAVSLKNFNDFMYADADRQSLLLASYLFEEGRSADEARKIMVRVTKKSDYGKLTLEEKRKITSDDEFKKLVGGGGNGRYVRQRPSEVGNPTADDLVWIGADRLHETFKSSQSILSGQGSGVGTFIPWIAENRGGNVVRAFGEVIAHEVGHALGLSHPGAKIQDPNFRRGYPTRKPHLMDSNFRDKVRPNVARFDELAFSYLKLVLGER